MFGFNKKVFGVAMSFFNGITLSATLLKCVSMNNRECKVRSEIINIISKEPVFFHCSIETSKWSGSCNNFSGSYAKMCVPDVIKNIS